MDGLGHVGAIAATAVSCAILIGILYRFVLLPNLRAELIQPALETNRQVTQNGGRNDPPTIPDKLHALQESIDALQAGQVSLAESLEKTADIAATAASAATAQRAAIDLSQTVLLEHIKSHGGHTHIIQEGDDA